jgi:prepilin-type processing-associated H-X9-DG protein
MVFPVFARARESARKAVCLSNVKNIALAIQMYLADNNDVLPPDEANRTAQNYLKTVPGGHPSRSYDMSDPADTCNRDIQANPYLRWPVILDEYVKNREVYVCPSNKVFNGAAWIVPGPNYLAYYIAYEGDWGKNSDDRSDGPCYPAFPPGWGGTVTDSFAQEKLAQDMGQDAVQKVFAQSVGINGGIPGLKLVAVNDPVNYYICGDSGVQNDVNGLGIAAYPDICALECSSTCGWADWDYCTWAADCGLYNNAPNDGSFLANPELRKPYARHLGGVNCGFLDGHASWIHSDLLVKKVAEGDIAGIDSWGPNSVDTWDGTSCYPAGGVYLY